MPITRDSNRQLLVNIVAELDRLPILIVDGDNVAAPLFGQLVGRELVGLVRVVLVRRFLIPGLNQELANYGAQLPFDGAVLVWPDAKSVLRHPQYTREDIDHGWFKQGNTRLNKLVGSLMRMLAPLSVAASGPNQILASARRAQADDIRAAREEQLRTQIAAATASATNEAKVQRLEELLESLRTENEELWAEYTQQEDRHKAEFARVTKDFALSFAQHRQSPTPQQQQGFELVPDLDDDLTALASYLSTEYDGAIVFTNAAHTSWRESNYPYPEKMREALIALAKAGTAYRDANGRTNGRFSDWMHLNFGVRMSVLDDTLSDLELDVFDFEDATYSRLPHLQLDDHTTRDRVGRVYFAIDDNDLRFIVDHVGLKLYGL